jgi:DNA polymerase III epsilon subunit-like protein
MICVDVETAGPNPGSYSLLSIGAASVAQPDLGFYTELQPQQRNYTEEAAAVHGLSMEKLAEEGIPPKEAMQSFANWLEQEACPGREPVFVAFNAPFDWLFVADYFGRYLGRNPFGHRALDIKALYMGMHAVAWEDTTHRAISTHYGLAQNLPHHALDDAQQEAVLVAAMLAELKERE